MASKPMKAKSFRIAILAPSAMLWTAATEQSELNVKALQQTTALCNFSYQYVLIIDTSILCALWAPSRAPYVVDHAHSLRLAAKPWR